MLDIALLRERPDFVKQKIKTKNADPALVDEFLALDKRWRELTSQAEQMRAEQKKKGEARDIDGAKALKELIKKSAEEAAAIEADRDEIWAKIPNLPSGDTPEGKDESANKVLRRWGEPRDFAKEGFAPKDHVALGESLGIIDTETAAKVAGTRFGYLKGGAAMLQFALVQFGLEVLRDEKILRKLADKVEKGYSAQPFVPVVPPVMIRPDVLQKMARLEPREERYHIASDDLFLVGSAEHALGPMHMGEIIAAERFPIRYAGYSTSFRREAGSYGKDTRGILRVHQFDKLEMESFTKPEDGMKEQEFIISIQEYLMQKLELPYQVVFCSTGDQGDPDARHLDINAWMPGEGKYRETHSSDYMTDYQSRRLGTKVRLADGKTEFVHMNDATVFSQRPILAILENYQTKEGKIAVPKVLQKYAGIKIIG